MMMMIQKKKKEKKFSFELPNVYQDKINQTLFSCLFFTKSQILIHSRYSKDILSCYFCLFNTNFNIKIVFCFKYENYCFFEYFITGFLKLNIKKEAVKATVSRELNYQKICQTPTHYIREH